MAGFLTKFVGFVGVGLASHFAYTKATKFEEEITVDSRDSKENCTVSPIIGKRFMVYTKDKAYNTRRILWTNPPNLEQGGIYDRMYPGLKYHVEGYGLYYPKLHLYPNITNARLNTDSRVYYTLNDSSDKQTDDSVIED